MKSLFKSAGTNVSIDGLLVVSSIVYVSLPVMIFFVGWLNPFVSLPAIAVFLLFVFRTSFELTREPLRLIDKASAKFWISALSVLCIWVFLSGIGGFGYQNGDFAARNPVYRDLCNYDWPVVYDLSEQNLDVRAIMGSGVAAFSYYFSWWLVPALVSKLFSLGQTGQSVCLFLWALIGVFLVTYHLCRYFRRTSYVILAILVFFSGLDVIGYFFECISKGSLATYFPSVLYKHVEWWPESFQLSSMTSQLFWVFNQSIPVWLIMILFLQLDGGPCFLALASLTFAFSPWAAFGVVPIALSVLFKDKDGFRRAFSFQNIAVPLSMMVVYGAFYSAGTGVGGESHFNLTGPKAASNYLCMVFLEVLVFLLAMGKNATKYKFYWVVFAELLLFPLYTLFQYSFHIRGTIPPLFLLMTFTMKFLLEDRSASRKILLSAILAIGGLTAMGEMNRSVAAFLLHKQWVPVSMAKKVSKDPSKDSAQIDRIGRDLRREDVYSIGKMRTHDEETIKLFMNQFFIFDYEQSFFFKYLAKETNR